MTASTKDEYERLATTVLAEGHLGHGIQEDLLLEATKWFGLPLVEGNGAFSDFFRAALDYHVALLCAVDLDVEQADDRQEFLEFLRVLLRWIEDLPQEVVRKSANPLLLVVGWEGVGHQLGAQVMRAGGPSVIFWGAFRSLRASLHLSSYRRLTQLIRMTLAHELIGHQLAFCTSEGPLVGRDDLRAIMAATGIRFLELVDSPSMSAETFLALPDLLTAITRVRYYGSELDMHRYCTNLTELIAFTVAGNPAHSRPPSAGIETVLRRGLLRERLALAKDAATGIALYRGYDLSRTPFAPYFVEHSQNGWRETDAVLNKGRWLTLCGLWDAWKVSLSDTKRGAAVVLLPGKKLLLNVESASYLVDGENVRVLICLLGVYESGPDGTPVVCAPLALLNAASVSLDRRPVDPASYCLVNRSPREITVRVVTVDYLGLSAHEGPSSLSDLTFQRFQNI